MKKGLIKRILACALAAVIGISGLPVHTYAEEATGETTEESTGKTASLSPDILRVQLYTDKDGTTPKETPAASSGASNWYLRYDYISFLTFDLSSLKANMSDCYLTQGIFSVIGKRDGTAGKDNEAAVYCLENAITETSTVPTVTLVDGTKTTVTYDNVSKIAKETVKNPQKFYRQNIKTTSLDLTDSIYNALKNGADSVTFLIVTNDNYKGIDGCDLQPATASLDLKFAEYTDEQKVIEAVSNLQEKYTDYCLKESVSLETKDKNGADIAWRSSNEGVLSSTGAVVGTVSGVQTVQMTAAVSSGAIRQSCDFDFHVCDPQYYSVFVAKKQLEKQLGYLQNTDVTSDIGLVTGLDNVAVQWSSDHPDVVNESGVVTRPAVGEEDVEVKLTATITSNDNSAVSDTYELTVKVLAVPDADGAGSVAGQCMDMLSMIYDGTIVLGDFDLPAVWDDTATTTTEIEWAVKEESEYFTIGGISNDAYPVTVAPQDEEQKVTVTCTVKTTGNTTGYTATLEKDMTFVVAKNQETSPYGRTSLQNIVDFSEASSECVSV